jgi:uncharacterized membrane protein YoaK (UPF0700 family)
MKAGSRDRSWPILLPVIGLRLLAVLVIGAQPACTAKPFVLDGNASYARVTYTGDMERATEAAKRHCAPFERVPRFREIDENIAYFDCVRP